MRNADAVMKKESAMVRESAFTVEACPSAAGNSPQIANSHGCHGVRRIAAPMIST